MRVDIGLSHVRQWAHVLKEQRSSIRSKRVVKQLDWVPGHQWLIQLRKGK